MTIANLPNLKRAITLFTFCLSAGMVSAAEPWADARLSVVDGLELWLDASRQVAARQAHQQPALATGADVDVWFDASGKGRKLRQSLAAARPKFAALGETPVVRFDGVDDHLRAIDQTGQLEAFTVFLVVAPKSNPGGFRGFMAFNAEGQRDWTSGLTIDQGPGGSAAFAALNIEGRGFTGAQSLMRQTFPFGTAHICEIAADDTIRLIVDGKPAGERKRQAEPISLQEITIGARYYTNEAAPQQARGFVEADIAEVLVYNRVLTENEHKQVRDYLNSKYADLMKMTPEVAGTPLVPVANPPAVQVFAPGFEARQLPLDLPNINNVRCRPDGKLLALAYDGDLYLLSDSDGDGLEDRAETFWKNDGNLRAPVGMALTPPGYARGNGALVTGKGKCTLIVDTDSDDRADKEIVVADGWKEGPHGVDAIGAAIDPKDGSFYFSRGAASFTNAYLVDERGESKFSLSDERGTILRVSPDLKTREIFCTGTRFPVALTFRGDGELFCSDQEGATWLANGNPFDELLHIQRGKHYGFPPRHPKRLPNVIDEPSVFDYVPQHQSTCGLVFNEPVVAGGTIFGPEGWRGDAIVAGYSRGKLYRTSLLRTDTGYVARNALLACLNQLTVEGSVTRDGSLVVATHSGGPDWGTGPSGKGKLFKIRYRQAEIAQPVATWAAGPGEVRVAFDRPLDPERLRGITSQVTIQHGAFVRAGDRFESLRPGYAVVGAQLAAPRFDQAVRSVQLSSDLRTLILLADPDATVDLRALTLPTSILGEAAATTANAIQQHPQIDLDYDLTGVEARWQNTTGEVKWSGWLPHVDLDVSRAFTAGSASHEELWKLLATPGRLTLTAQLDLVDMLRPAVQPGTTIDYAWPDESVTVSVHGSGEITLRSPGMAIPGSPRLTTSPQRGKLTPIELTLATSKEPAKLSLHWTTAEDDRPRAFPLRRLLVPWGETKARSTAELVFHRAKELDGGSWARGRKVFFDEKFGCAKCHSVHGRGAIAAPDLSNLLHRDYASVLRDVAEPSYAINPDFVTYTVAETSGRALSGTVRTVGEQLLLTDQTGKVHTIERKNIDEIAPSRISTMPNDMRKLLGPERLKDVLTFLLTPAPQMPRDALLPAPPPRMRAEVRAVLEGAPDSDAPGSQAPRELRITLVAGPKDHGPGEHDYPAWQKSWEELLGALDHTVVNTAWQWPSADDLAKSDILVFYQHGTWSAEKARDIDAFLKRGGGLVYLHFAVDGGPQPAEFAERIGFAWKGGQSKFRHGPLELAFSNGASHPIARNFKRVKLVDESYWRLVGRVTAGNVLATALEDGEPQPLFWAIESGGGRVFVSIPGHYSWTFDDPLFRILILRGMAWTAREPVDRLNDAVWPGAQVMD